MVATPSPDNCSAIITTIIATGLTAIACFLGQRAASKLDKRQMYANRLVEFFEGDNLIKATADFNKLANHYTEEQAIDIVLHKGKVHEHY